MPYVTNISMSAAKNGRFPSWVGKKNTILIQIQDVDNSPTARFTNVKRRSLFVDSYQFRFNDVERENSPHWDEQGSITDKDAQSLASIIQDAKQRDLNILVHCHAGLCRSGAITEVAVMCGFEDIDNNERIPNCLVKEKVRKALGLLYSWE